MAPRVLTGLFGHETNTFSQLATGHSDFEDYLLAAPFVDNGILGSNSDANRQEGQRLMMDSRH